MSVVIMVLYPYESSGLFFLLVCILPPIVVFLLLLGIWDRLGVQEDCLGDTDLFLEIPQTIKCTAVYTDIAIFSSICT